MRALRASPEVCKTDAPVFKGPPFCQALSCGSLGTRQAWGVERRLTDLKEPHDVTHTHTHTHRHTHTHTGDMSPFGFLNREKTTYALGHLACQ